MNEVFELGGDLVPVKVAYNMMAIIGEGTMRCFNIWLINWGVVSCRVVSCVRVWKISNAL